MGRNLGSTDGISQIVTSDLRALLFWAAIGMRNAKGGAYADDLINILECYAEEIKLTFDRPLEWGSDLPPVKTRLVRIRSKLVKTKRASKLHGSRRLEL
jgi:hypothetical protein